MSGNDKSRRQLYLLGGLVAVLVVLLYVRFGPTNAAPSGAAPAGTRSQPSNQATGTATSQVPVSDVRLEALTREETHLAEAERNPFRFRPKAAPPAPPQPVTPPRQTYVPPPVATGPPPPPPIPLKYVGLYGTPTQADRVAILADARGNPFYGREGDIIEGRYRVLRIATDSVDVAYADGRGRQTIRLSSQ
jgi:hypothetical protein